MLVKDKLVCGSKPSRLSDIRQNPKVYTDKRKSNFIQSGAVAKSFIRKGGLPNI